MSEDSEGQGYDLVMPFVTVASKGGPHEDEAYTAGWQMGALDMRLEWEMPHVHHEVIRTDCVEQADRIAMKHGLVAHFIDLGSGWTDMQLHRDPEGPLP